MSTLRTNAVESITGTATDFPNSLSIQGKPVGSAATEPTSRFPYVVGSVAELIALPAGIASIGQHVKTLGYYAPGDGGGNDYEIVAAATGTDDGGSFIDLAESGPQAKGLFGREVDVRQFGAQTGDSFDSTSAIQSAIDATSAGISFGEGTKYHVTNLKGRDNLQMHGTCVLDYSQRTEPSTFAEPFLMIRGHAEENERFVAQDVAQGDSSVFIPDTSGIVPGDLIEIATPGFDGGFVEPTPAATNGELLVVKDVPSGTEIVLVERVIDEHGYSVAEDARVRKIDPVKNIEIGKGITFKGSGRPTSGGGDHGLYIWYGRDVKVHATFMGVDRSSLRFDSCYNYEASGCTLITDPKGASNAISYGIIPGSSSKHGRVFNNYCVNQRHAVVTSKVSTATGDKLWGIVRILDVYNNHVVGTWAAGISTHNDYEMLRVYNNRLERCSRGIEVRERNTEVVGNTFIHCGQSVVLNKFSKNLLVEGNRHYYSNNMVLVQAVSSKGLENIRVIGNYSVDSKGISINPVDASVFNNITISGNEILGASGTGIDVTNSPVSNCIIENNIIRNPSDRGMSVREGGDHIFIMDNHVEYAVDDSYRLVGTTISQFHAVRNNSISPVGSHFFGTGSAATYEPGIIVN